MLRDKGPYVRIPRGFQEIDGGLRTSKNGWLGALGIPTGIPKRIRFRISCFSAPEASLGFGTRDKLLSVVLLPFPFGIPKASLEIPGNPYQFLFAISKNA